MANEIHSKTIAATYGKLLITKSDSGFSGSSAGNERVIATDDKDGSITESCLAVGTARVGIGIAAPARLLDIENPSSGSDAHIRLGTNDADQDAIIELWTGLDSYGKTAIVAEGLNSNRRANLHLVVDTVADTNSYTLGTDTKMFIDGDNGRIGIGTVAPAYTLEVQGTGTQSIKVGSTDGSGQVIIDSGGTEAYNSSLLFESDGASKGMIYYDHHATPASQKMYFKVGDNAVNAMIIDGGGKVGIGTTSPPQQLSIHSSSGGIIALNKDDSNIANNEVLGKLMFGADDPSDGTFVTGATIEVQSAGTWDTGDSGAKIIFSTSADEASSVTEKMRISDTGCVGIGETAPANPLHVKGTATDFHVLMIDNSANSDSEGKGIIIKAGDGDHTSGSPVYITFQESDAGAVGAIDIASGNLRLQDASDERLKQNIVDTSIEGLNIINSLKIRDFEWKRSRIGKDNQKVVGGMIAQEVKDIYPQAIGMVQDGADGVETTSGDDGKPYSDLLGISKASFIEPLIKAVQELSAKVTALESA